MYRSFRAPDKQADHAVRQLRAHGVPRHGHAGDGQLHSIGTERSYRQALTGVAAYLKARDGPQGDLRNLDRDTALAYLALRAEAVGQKTLDLDRQAMQAVLAEPLPVVRAAQATALASRAYTPDQVRLVAAAQTARHALATEIAANAGLRAHELLTLRPADEQPASAHRTWSAARFAGRGDVVRYTVAGKGGLVREVALDRALAARLEAVRLPESRTVYDREVRYASHYAFGGGRPWADSFTKAAVRVLGWTEGAHGLRHTYAQARMATLQGLGCRYAEALAVVSQELGHFRPDITEVYLR